MSGQAAFAKAIILELRKLNESMDSIAEDLNAISGILLSAEDEELLEEEED